MSGDCCGCCEQEEGRRKAAEGRIQTMAEDWTTLLTEKEQRRLAASSKYCHSRGLAHACCDELPGLLRSLAASREEVAGFMKDRVLASHLMEDTVEVPHTHLETAE